MALDAYVEIAQSIAINLFSDFGCPNSTEIANQCTWHSTSMLEIVPNRTSVSFTWNRSAVNAEYCFIISYSTLQTDRFGKYLFLTMSADLRTCCFVMFALRVNLIKVTIRYEDQPMSLCASIISLVLQFSLGLAGNELACFAVLPELINRVGLYRTQLPIVWTMKSYRPILHNFHSASGLKLILASSQFLLDHTHRAAVLSAGPAAYHHIL